MPQQYSYYNDSTTVECSHCHQTRTFAGAAVLEGADATAEDGSLVTDFIRWLPARGRFHSWCRACERGARASNPNRQARRSNTAPADRKFGVELELKFPSGRSYHEVRDALIAAGLTNWKVKGDGSLTQGNGMEITSPPLQGDNGFEKVRIACRVLREQGARVDRQTGLHVHHDASDLGLAALKRVARCWKNTQPMIDGLVSPSRRGAANPFYCMPLTSTDVQRIEDCTSLARLRTCGAQRYRTLNFRAYGKFGTLEVRQHQGTCDAEKITSWVKLGQAIIAHAKATTEPLATPSRMRDFVTTLGHRLDETAATFILGRAVQFAAVEV